MPTPKARPKPSIAPGPRARDSAAAQPVGAASKASALQPLALGPLGTIVGYHIAQAAVTTFDAFERHIGKPFGLRKVEFSLLMLLTANGPVSPKQLGSTLTLTAPNLSLLLDRLQQRDLIRRQPNPLDGRSMHIVLTPAGRKLAGASAAAALPMERELQFPLSRAEHAMLIELLGKVAHPPST